ncbi:MAG: carbon storage regulator [Pirellulaceae bacterium]
MLVLSRKKGQSIEIGKGITVTVTQIKGNQVRLGIKAPPEVPIHRNELVIDDHGIAPMQSVSVK